MNAVQALKAERGKLAKRIAVLDKAIAILGGGGTSKRKMSAATKRKIARTQKKRWKDKKAGS